jgi:hypothetical protein
MVNIIYSFEYTYYNGTNKVKHKRIYKNKKVTVISYDMEGNEILSFLSLCHGQKITHSCSCSDDEKFCSMCRLSDGELINTGCEGENKHNFHFSCLKQWFTETNHEQQFCPYCCSLIDWNKCKNVV